MVAYYAHSHGNGHCNSARLFAESIYNNTLILTSRTIKFPQKCRVLNIPDEDTTPQEYKDAVENLPSYAHYLPKSNAKIIDRCRQILDAIANFDIKVACIDVSVETAIIFRIASVPYGYCLLPGNRTDNPHTTAFEAAEFLFAFFPAQMFAEVHNRSFHSKTFYLGFVSKYEYTSAYRIVEGTPTLENKKILIICGNGGTNFNTKLISEIIFELRECTVRIAGNLTGESYGCEKNYLGYLDAVEQEIREADIVISSCGMNLTSEILALKNKFVAFPENRPYGEQKAIAKALVKNKLAVAFNYKNLRNVLLSYLQLEPHKDLENWFCDSAEMRRLKRKIEHYEK